MKGVNIRMSSLIFRLVLIFALLVGTTSLLIAQESKAVPSTLSGQITGQVRYEGGKPAVNIMVSCDSFNLGNCGQAMTDGNGRFRFTNLGPSQFVISVRAPGFIEQNECRTNDNLRYATFRLGRMVSQGQPRWVRGSRRPCAPTAKKEFDQATAAGLQGKERRTHARCATFGKGHQHLSAIRSGQSYVGNDLYGSRSMG